MTLSNHMQDIAHADKCFLHWRSCPLNVYIVWFGVLGWERRCFWEDAVTLKFIQGMVFLLSFQWAGKEVDPWVISKASADQCLRNSLKQPLIRPGFIMGVNLESSGGRRTSKPSMPPVISVTFQLAVNWYGRQGENVGVPGVNICMYDFIRVIRAFGGWPDFTWKIGVVVPGGTMGNHNCGQ